MRRTAVVTAIALAAVALDGGAYAARVAGPPVAGPAADAAAAAQKPVTERPDAVSASMSARKQGVRVEVANARTETSTTYANPNGTFTMEQSEQPVRVKRGGGWVPVDTTLVVNPDGSVSPKAAPAGLRLSGGNAPSGARPGTHDDAPVADQDLVTLGTGDSAVTLAWHGKLPKPVLSGSTATYPDAIPGADLKIQATRTGFETFLVIKAKPAGAVSFTLPLKAKGLSAKPRKDGGLDFTDAKGHLLGSMPAPSMWDSQTDASTGMPTHTAPVAVSATSSGGVMRLTYTADQAFLDHAHFPVTVDPATSLGRNHWLLTSASEPTRTYFDSDNNADVGTPNGGTNVYRSFFSFDPTALWGKHILSATLNTNETHSWTCTASPVELWDTGAFTSSSNWSNQPAFTTKLGTQTVANGYSSSCPAANVPWTVTSEVQGWATGSAAVGTMALRATSETDSTQWKWFDNNPSISVTYNSYPSAPGGQTVTPSVTTGGTLFSNTPTPTLSTSATDADGGNLSYTFQVKSGSTVVATGTVSGVASGATASWTPPALANGAYTWQVQAGDGTDTGAWSAAQAFTVNANIDAAPSVGSSGYPAGVWTAAISGGTAFTFGDTSSDVAGYVYGLDTNPPSTFTTGTSVTLNPGPGLHTLYVQAQNSSGNRSGVTSYTFGVGTSGVAEPADQSTASSTVNLKADAPAGATSVRFQYRVGTSGAFADIPVSAVTNAGAALSSWPVATTATTGGVVSPELVWKATTTLAGDGPVQIQAVFDTVTSPVATVILQRNGIGSDFASTTLGPVNVGLQSGNASLPVTDVSIASYRAGLGVSRTFNSLAPSAPSVFGPGWTASLPVLGTSASWSSLVDDTSYAQLTGADGSVMTFNVGTTTGGVTSYTGQGGAAASGLVLTKSSAGFLLTDGAGTQVSFVAPNSSAPTVYAPSRVTQPGTNKSIGYTYSGGKLQLVTAPDPTVADNASTAAACAYPVASATWSPGCRGLVFKYDAASGNVSEVDFVAVDNTAGFQQIPVAQYAYDANSRLVAEWDPRVSPALKNQYTYDSNGRLASVTPAQDPATGNLKPYTFTYDNTPGDLDYGKLLNVTRTHGDSTAAVQSVVYRVPITKAAGGPLDMDASTIAGWGQTDAPVSAVAEFPADHVPGAAPDYTWATLHYYDANGKETNTASYGNGWHVTTSEYDANGDVVRQLSAAGRETALGGTATPASPAYVARTGSHVSTGSTSLTSVTVPVGHAVTAGDALVVSAMLTNTNNNTVAGNVTATDSQGDTFTVVADSNDGSSKDRTLLLAAYGVHALSTSDTVTLNFPATTEHQVAVDELSGVSGLDQKSSATGAAGTNFNSGTTATTTAPNEVVFGVAGIQGGTTSAWTGGFTGLPTVSVSSDQLATGYKTVSATGGYNATGTASHAWMSAVATFRAGANTAAIAKQLDTEFSYSADGTELIDSYGPMTTVAVAGYATPQQARAHTHYVYDEGAPNGGKDANGNPFRLITTTTESASLGATVPGSVDTDARTSKRTYSAGTDNSGWTLRSPLQTTTDPTGLAITRTQRFNTDSGLYNGEPLLVSVSQPSDTAGSGAGTRKTVYYTAGSNSADAACGSQPNWADLVCKTYPAAQPGTSGLANLAVTSFTYNLYLQPLTKTEDFGSGNTRTTTTTYDAMGRGVRTSVTTAGTGMGAAVPDTVTVYSTATGAPTHVESVDSANHVTADLVTGYDEFGLATSYTDADGTQSTFTYDLAGRTLTRNDGKGTLTYTYNGGNEHRGLPTSASDSQAGTFTGSYNADGNLVTQTLPGGTVATHVFGADGTPTSLSYSNSNSNWTSSLQDSVTPNIHHDWVNRSVLNSSQTYGYDMADRLATAKDTQAGICTTRTYGYDADSNRLSLATAAAGSGGVCQTTAPVNQAYTYDAADRLVTSGYVYDNQGDITTTPSADAGGTGDLTASYTATGMVAAQTQNGTTRTFALDPTGNRFRSFNDNGSAVTTNHYSSSADSPSWSVDGAGNWNRAVLDLAGQDIASVTAQGTVLQLPSLHGDVLATAATGTSTGPNSTATYTEFGATETSAGGSYGWLGAAQRANGLGGTSLMGARVYSTLTGRFSQTDPDFEGSASTYDYAAQNPLSNFDFDGRWCRGLYIISLCAGGGGFAIGMSTQQMNMFLNGSFGFAAAALGGSCAGLFGPTPAAAWCAAVAGGTIYVIYGQVSSWHPLPRSAWFNYRYGIHWKWGWIPIPYINYLGCSKQW